MSTRPATCRLASVTHRFPGPTRASTDGTLPVRRPWRPRPRRRHGEEAVGAGDGAGGKDLAGGRAAGTGRGADHHLADAGGPGRHHAHQHRGRVGRAPSRRVHAHALQRRPAPGDAHAWLHVQDHGSRDLGLMEPAHVGGRALQRRAEAGVQRGPGLVPEPARHLQEAGGRRRSARPFPGARRPRGGARRPGWPPPAPPPRARPGSPEEEAAPGLLGSAARRPSAKRHSPGPWGVPPRRHSWARSWHEPLDAGDQDPSAPNALRRAMVW